MQQLDDKAKMIPDLWEQLNLFMLRIEGREDRSSF